VSLTTKPGTGEARVLACLAKCSGEGLTIAQLCERLSRTPSTVRTSLRKLLQEGAVVREVGQSEHDITWRAK